ncbi:MAG TPA: hypothetical protein VMU07_00820 [Candidatus Paceibacterota bacterium]|nr:hypothetical protein [Candidatus Paceibacterota bacterium]
MNPRIWTKEVIRREFLFAFFDLLLLIVPGAGIVFVFNPIAFESIDWIKLVLLSGAITAPLSFMNMIFLSSLDPRLNSKNKNELFFQLSLSIVITTLILYALTASSYLFWGNSGRNFAIGLIIAETGLGLVAAIKDIFWGDKINK